MFLGLNLIPMLLTGQGRIFVLGDGRIVVICPVKVERYRGRRRFLHHRVPVRQPQRLKHLAKSASRHVRKNGLGKTS
jgi:ribosomal protein L24E